MIRILMVDDHSIVRSGIRRLLGTRADVALIEAMTGEEALELVGSAPIQLVLLDLNLPGLAGLELLNRLLKASPQSKVLVFSMHAEPIYVRRTLQAGAMGYLSKNVAPDELLRAIDAILEGKTYVECEIADEMGDSDARDSAALRPLTKRELEIMRLLARGHSLTKIAATLGVAYKTVANTCGIIKEKLGVSSTADLIRISVDRGLA